jgi:cytochrome c-type biogenesis protein CcmF
MRSVGQLCLLTALVCSAYTAFVYVACRFRPQRVLQRAATICGLTACISLSGAIAILAFALLQKDFSFDYVAHYSSRHLSWQYSLSALWVGQGGSLLLWAWLLSVLAVVFRLLPTRDTGLRDAAFGIIMGSLCFLAAIMVFAADPLKGGLSVPKEGNGLSPILQHPSMLIHPPVIFLAYAAWTVPFALAAAALIRGQLDAAWTHMARPWALLAWAVLLIGLLLGANWAYEELGWGGYWGWDPVENGSLLPWLAGTAFIHCLMAWRHRDRLKKTAVGLAMVTFGLCHFATFLTRSGIFSSVHAFSESPIGWMFLALMIVLCAGGATGVVLRRQALAPQRAANRLLARETLILVSTFLLLMLTLVVMAGTLVAPVSAMLLGRTILVDLPFYNNALIPVGLLLLAFTAMVPLLRWGESPRPEQRRVLCWCPALGVAAMAAAYGQGVRQWISLAVIGLATMAGASLIGAMYLDARRRQPQDLGRGLLQAAHGGRRQYAGYVVHMGLMALAIGITGSSLGSRRHEAVMNEGDVMQWEGRQIRHVKLEQRELPDKLTAEAVLEVSRDGKPPVTLRPARHWHLLQQEWMSEVAIHSTWGGDFYTVLNAGLGDGKVALTFVDNPMMRWIWFGGSVASVSALAAIWPARRRCLDTSNLNDAARPSAGDRLLGNDDLQPWAA